MVTIALIVLTVLFLGSLPSWPDNKGWGYRWNYYPSAGLGVVIVALLVFRLLVKL